ncbi:transglycosylase SLT domain-containing protein [Methylobacterium sp. Leaf469]|uniref:transglycosylase SLT domain-containing protein n=1 Tax=Methylobacterium sp. Leaf469 TaxID=1736387 RepID=UPI00138F8235|nr:transglycosylase SLT domain-containing protein [Methylobacterium sp. Leaf469]
MTGTIVFGTGKTFTESGVDWINVLIPPGVADGWVRRANCTEVEDPSPHPLDPENFVRQCTLLERVLNVEPKVAPWFVTADFIIARALFETNMTSVRSLVAGVVDGPFRLRDSEWDSFLASGLVVATGMLSSDKRYPTLQIYAAMYRMYADAKQMSSALAAILPNKNDPFIPSYADLFNCYLFDVITAVNIRELEANPAKKLSDVLIDTQLNAITEKPQFSGLKMSTTIPDFVKRAEVILSSLLDGAFDKIKTYASDELPAATTGSEPGSQAALWLSVARQEEAAGVTEANQPDRIKAYFASTDYGPVGASIPHWCGAFAAFCIKRADTRNPVPTGAAVAAHWKNWGGLGVPLGAHDIPLGAVVVLTPSPGTITSGHVAFFVGFTPDGKKIRLLGGNQNDSVRISEYSTVRVAAIRIISSSEPSSDAANRFDLTAAGVPKVRHKYGDLIVDRFKRAGFVKDQHLLAILANAIAESGLDPNAKSPAPEESYGLFQCNRTHGLGKGYTIDQLKDPEINISIIIAESRKYSQFASASTTQAAVEAFVRFIERPANTSAAISKRLKIADLLT